jgi:hypothetical protein
MYTTKPRLTSKLLQKYYATVKDLGSYLDEILDEVPAPIAAADGDSVAYANLLSTTVVGLRSQEEAPRRFLYAPPMSDMREVRCCTGGKWHR